MSNDETQRVKEATDIVEVIGSYVELRRAGSGFSAKCPFHDDRNPSLSISAARQTWRCFVCDIGGDAYSWVMRFEGLGFRDALEKLADRAGIILTGDGKPAVAAGVKAKCFESMEWAVNQYRKALTGDALQYVTSRGISKDSIDKFEIGFAPEDKWGYLLDQCGRSGFNATDLETAGLVAKSDKGRYDRFHGRVIFPIRDLQGRCIALGGRVLPGKGFGGKYTNSPESPVFSKSKTLYAINLARDPIRKAKQSIVMEGYTDVIIAHQAGVTNAVACLGTAFGESHIKQLRYHGDQIALVLDGDDAGQKRAETILPMLIGIDAKILTLPNGKDPADFIAEDGAVKFRRMIESAPDPVAFKVRRAFAGVSADSDPAKVRAAIEASIELVAKADPIVRAQAETEIARASGLKIRDISEAVASKKFKAKERVEVRQTTVGDIKLRHCEWAMFALMVSQPESVSGVLSQLDPSWISSVGGQKLLALYAEAEMDGRELDVNSMMALAGEQEKSMLVSAVEQSISLGRAVCPVAAANSAIELVRLEYDRELRHNAVRNELELGPSDGRYSAACQSQAIENSTS